MTFTQLRTPMGRLRVRCSRCNEAQTGTDAAVSRWKQSHMTSCPGHRPRPEPPLPDWEAELTRIPPGADT